MFRVEVIHLEGVSVCWMEELNATSSATTAIKLGFPTQMEFTCLQLRALSFRRVLRNSKKSPRQFRAIEFLLETLQSEIKTSV